MRTLSDIDALLLDGEAASILSRPITPADSLPRLREAWIAIRTDGIPDPADGDATKVVVIGDGSRENPWDGSTALKFDAIMRVNVGTNTLIHLGVGLFRTRGGGSWAGVGFWRPQSGQVLKGAGMFQTTLLLVDQLPKIASTKRFGYFGTVVGTTGDNVLTLLDGFSISDLTIDCGGDDQPLDPGAPYSWPQMATAALNLAGKNISVQRVRIINNCTRSPGELYGKSFFADHDSPNYDPNLYPLEDFVCSLNPNGLFNQGGTSALSYDQVMEDCIIEQPYHSNGREVTFTCTGPSIPLGTVKRVLLRRCLINAEFTNRLPYPGTRVASVEYNSGSVQLPGYSYNTSTGKYDLTTSFTFARGTVQTVRTTGFHNVKGGALIEDPVTHDPIVTGVYLGNVPRPFYVEISGAEGNTAYNGRFLVVSPERNDGSSRTLQILMTSDPGPTPPTGTMIIQDSPAPTMDVVSLVLDGTYGTITTATPHKRRKDDWVVLSGADLYDYGYARLDIYNGSYKVYDVPTPSTFRIQTTTTGTPKGAISLDRRPSLEVALFNITKGGLSSAGRTWTVETWSPHWRKPHEWVLMSGVFLDATTNVFDGYVEVSAVISPTKFEIVTPDTSATPVCGNAFIGSTFQAHQFGDGPQAVVERNRVFNANHGGNYHDTWDRIDLLARKNYYYNCYLGLYENFYRANAFWGVWDVQWPAAASGQHYGWTPSLFNHGVLVGSPIPIPSSAGAPGVLIKIKAQQVSSTSAGENPQIPAQTSVRITNGDGTSEHPATVVQVGVSVGEVELGNDGFYYLTVAVESFDKTTYDTNGIWYWKDFQTLRLIHEDNIYDMAFSPRGGNFGPVGALFFSSYANQFYQIAGQRFYSYVALVLRGNLIRSKDGETDPFGQMVPIRLNTARGAIVEDNIMSSTHPNPFGHQRCGTLKLLNNQTPAGTVIRPLLIFPNDPTAAAPTNVEEDPFDVYEDWLIGW